MLAGYLKKLFFGTPNSEDELITALAVACFVDLNEQDVEKAEIRKILERRGKSELISDVDKKIESYREHIWKLESDKKSVIKNILVTNNWDLAEAMVDVIRSDGRIVMEESEIMVELERLLLHMKHMETLLRAM